MEGKKSTLESRFLVTTKMRRKRVIANPPSTRVAPHTKAPRRASIEDKI